MREIFEFYDRWLGKNWGNIVRIFAFACLFGVIHLALRLAGH